jgi:hypothetical protein
MLMTKYCLELPMVCLLMNLVKMLFLMELLKNTKFSMLIDRGCLRFNYLSF